MNRIILIKLMATIFLTISSISAAFCLTDTDPTLPEHMGTMYLSEGSQNPTLADVVSLNEMSPGELYERGEFYRTKVSVDQDEKLVNEKMTFDCYQRAAEQGYAPAQNALGCCYSLGMGVEKDDKNRVLWLARAVTQDNMKAQCNLGYCYMNGLGVDKDVKRGIRLYQLSVAQGHSPAQNNLAILYLNGRHVRKSYGEGIRLLNLSVAQGCEKAKKILATFYGLRLAELSATDQAETHPG